MMLCVKNAIRILWIMAAVSSIYASNIGWPMKFDQYNCVGDGRDSWVRSAWDDSHVQVVYQVHPNMFVCGFAIQLENITQCMDLLLRKGEDGSIYIKQTRSFLFDKETESQHCIFLQKTDDQDMQKSTVNLNVVGAQEEVFKDQKTYKMLPHLAFKMFGHTLCITAGGDFNLPVLPQALDGQNIYFTPSLNGVPPGIIYDLKGDVVHTILPERHLIVRYYRHAKLPNALSRLSFVHCDKIPKSNNLFVQGHDDQFDRRIDVRPDCSLEECFLLSLTCPNNVFIRPWPCVIRPASTFPLWNILWESVGEDGESYIHEQDVFCTLVNSNGQINVWLYSVMAGYKQHIRRFSFPAYELKEPTRYLLRYCNNTPYLLYPIAQTFSLALCCGKAVDEGPFYMCNVYDEAISKTAFVGTNSTNDCWKNIGFPHISSADYSIAPVPINISGQKTPIFSINFSKRNLNSLMFYYNIEPVEDGYCMCVKAQSPFCLPGNRVQDIKIQMSKGEVLTHQVSIQCESGLIVVHLAPKVFFSLLRDVPQKRLKTWLNIDGFIQEWCGFSFHNLRVVQHIPPVLPLPEDYNTLVSSNATLCFDDTVQRVLVRHQFEQNNCPWERSIQFLRSGSKKIMHWRIGNLRSGCEAICSVNLAQEEGTLLYYTCYTHLPCVGEDISVTWACGAVLMEVPSGRFIVKKARSDQIYDLPKFDEMQLCHVQDWDSYVIKIVPNTVGFADFKAVLDGQRIQFAFDNHYVYLSPVSSCENSLSFETFFADFHIKNEEPHQVVVDRFMAV